MSFDVSESFFDIAESFECPECGNFVYFKFNKIDPTQPIGCVKCNAHFYVQGFHLPPKKKSLAQRAGVFIKSNLRSIHTLYLILLLAGAYVVYYEAQVKQTQERAINCE